MELTELEKLLIHLFRAFEMRKEEVCGMMMLLETTEQQEKMLHWIRHHTNATKLEIAREGFRICQTTKWESVVIH